MNKEEIIIKIKDMLIERLMLDLSPDEIQNEAPLFNSEAINKDKESEIELLGLDSVDALEILVGMQDLFNIKLSTEKNPEAFYSVDSLAESVIENQSKE